MPSLDINVAQIEEWQTIRDLASLDTLFQRAQSVLTGGGTVELFRTSQGARQRFDTFTTLEELAVYKTTVYKYL